MAQKNIVQKSTQENMDSVLRKRFEYFDITKNGKISKWELKEMMNSKGKIRSSGCRGQILSPNRC